VAQFARHGLLVLGIVVAAESFGSPLPGELGLFLAAYEIHRGRLDPFLALAVATAAAICADNLAYLLGRWAGRPLLVRVTARLHLRGRFLERLDGYFERHARATVTVARWISPLRGLTALSAGASQLPWRRFAPYNALGVISWAATLLGVAILCARHLEEFSDLLSRDGLLGLAALVAAGVLLVTWRRRRRTHARMAAQRRRTVLREEGQDCPPT
jgi:membrane protein DedA with SNARE-associated domain